MNRMQWRWPGGRAAQVLQHPAAFALQVLRGFRANQGLLLAGAVAYYALLSIVPLLVLAVIALSHVVDQTELLLTIGRYLEWLVPGQSKAIVAELARFLTHRDVMSWVLAGTMLFFSSLAFTVLEGAMSVIFLHRVVARRRHYLVSAVIPYCYILCLGLGLLLATLVAGSLQAMGESRVDFLWRSWSLEGRVRHPAVPAGAGRRDLRAHLGVPGDAGRAALAAARAARRRGSGTAVGGVAPRAGLVLLDAVADRHGLRIADHRHRGAAEPGARRDAAAAGSPGDLRVRAGGRARFRPHRAPFTTGPG